MLDSRRRHVDARWPKIFPGGSARKNCQPAHLGPRPTKLASATTESGDASGIGQQGKNPALGCSRVPIHCNIAQITSSR